MIKRLLVMFFLVLGILPLSVYSECFFGSMNSQCQTFSNSFNTFNVNFDDLTNLDSFQASIYKKGNPSNKLKVSVGGSVVKNINPFVEPGVYVLSINAKNKAGTALNKNFEFVFDNTKPLGPVIDLEFKSNVDSVLINGKATPYDEVIAKDVTGTQVGQVSVDLSGNFQMSLNLNSGINYFAFYTKGLNGVLSEPIERVVLKTSFSGSSSSSFSVSDLVQTNFRTYKDSETYFTSKRNFYVSGSGDSGTVYLNGQKMVVDSIGNFGGFILLNEGNNKLKVQSGSNVVNLDVVYVSPRFKFFSLNYDKVVSSDLTITGDVNYNLPVDIYLNGNYVTEIIPERGSFSYVLTGLKTGKNYVYLEGFNGERKELIVYKDVLKPQVSMMMPTKIALDNKFIFEVKDDTGVDSSNVEVKIGDKTFSGSIMDVSGDFYTLDISSIEDGSYDYSVYARDRAGNDDTITGTLDINKQNTLFENMNIANGYWIGDKIFLKKGENRILISPSRYIAFKKIYLDGKEVIDYDIKENGDIDLSADFESEKGVIDFSYINSLHEEFNQTFEYYTDDERPVVNLDYVDTDSAKDGGRIKVTGSVMDSNFDWSTLKFNSNSDFLRFGDNFEAFVPITSENLVISGRDYSLNEISNSLIGGLFAKDVRKTGVSLSSSKNSLTGTLTNTNTNIKNYVYKYDGSSMSYVFVPVNFEFGVQQREGLRSVNLGGFEDSSYEFSSIDSFSVDNLKPEIYFKDSGSNLRILIDGTLSAVDDSSLEILIDGVKATVINNCNEKISVFSKCVEVVKGSSVSVSVKDSYGNLNSKTFEGNFGVINDSGLPIEIFFNGNDKYTNSKNYFVQGQIISSTPLVSVKAQGKDCKFDDFNFVCYVSLNSGDNIVIVSATNLGGESSSSNYMINYVVNDISVSINDAKGYGVFKSGSQYFVNLDGLNVSGILNKDAIVDVLIEGKRVLVGTKNGNFTIPINLGDNIIGKNSDDIDLWLEAQDEYGNKGVSNKIKLIYNRLLETILKIIVS